MKYNVTIQESLGRILQIESETEQDALSKARRLYSDSCLVLGPSDYLDTQIFVDDSEPFFCSSDNLFTFFKADCCSLLDKLSNTFDMVFADPPYFLSSGGISCQSGEVVCVDKGEWDKPTTREDMDRFNFRWLKVVREHMKDNATIWISGTHHNIFSVQQQLIKLGFKILNVITWVKTNPPPNISCRFFTYSTEYLIWARKSAKIAHFFNYELMKKVNGGKQMKDVWELPAIAKWEKLCGKHPTQKPLSLLCRIILASTKPGDLVLDPFAGSSTTGIAANLLGRNFVGVEKEQEYAELSKRRRLELETKEQMFISKIKDLNAINFELGKY